MKELHGSDPTWGEENMQEKHIQLLQEQNPGLQDYLGSQFFITIFQILRLFGVVWDCFGLFGVVVGNSSPFSFPLAIFQLYSHVPTLCQQAGSNPSAALCNCNSSQRTRKTQLSPQELAENESWAESALLKRFSEHTVSMNVFFLSHVPEIPETTLHLSWTRGKIRWKSSWFQPTNLNSAQGPHKIWIFSDVMM